MDPLTLKAYDEHAAQLCALHREIVPRRMQDLALGFFQAGAETADIGCGCGRDTAWLVSQGFSTIGYDASPSMLAEARATYPGLRFEEAALPDLGDIESATFSNVLCFAVLMHLPREELITAALSLARILRPRGRLLLSWRRSRSEGEREPDGRLYTPIEPGRLILLLEAAGLQVLQTEEQEDPIRPGLMWHVVLAEKSPLDVARGLDRIQAILAQDRKVATYKLALVRALCAIGRAESHLVVWQDGAVYVPLQSIATRWLAYYWPLVTSEGFLAQMRGEKENGAGQLAFRRAILALKERYTAEGLYFILRAIEQDARPFLPILRRLAATIRNGPVTYSGTTANPVFSYVDRIQSVTDVQSGAGALGWVKMQEVVWLDICRFDHWIEDSVIVRWARLSTEMNPDTEAGDFLPLLLSSPGDVRDTQEVRQLLRDAGEPLMCVWSGRKIQGDPGNLHVDHAIPFAVWGNNDLWNLLPCARQVNLAKSDALPSLALLRRREDAIVHYWRLYRGALDGRFDTQVQRALGCSPGQSGWERAALAGLQETLQRLAAARGLTWWDPAAQGGS